MNVLKLSEVRSFRRLSVDDTVRNCYYSSNWWDGKVYRHKFIAYYFLYTLLLYNFIVYFVTPSKVRSSHYVRIWTVYQTQKRAKEAGRTSKWGMNGGQKSHGHCRLRTSHLPATSLQLRESSNIDILRPTAESVETYFLISTRTLWYSTYSVRNFLFGHIAGVSDRYHLPMFYNCPLAPWGTAWWDQDWSPCTDPNVTLLTSYPQWYGPDNQNIHCSTNLNNVHMLNRRHQALFMMYLPFKVLQLPQIVQPLLKLRKLTP